MWIWLLLKNQLRSVLIDFERYDLELSNNKKNIDES